MILFVRDDVHAKASQKKKRNRDIFLHFVVTTEGEYCDKFQQTT